MLWRFIQKHAQFVRFCVVGASGVLVNLAAIWLLMSALGRRADTASTLLANGAALVGWVVSVASNFALNDRWTFARAAASYHLPWPARLLRYYVSALSGLAVQLAGLNAARYLLAFLPWPAEWLGLRFYAANLCGIAAGTVVNYLVSKRFVFSRKAA